mgnify:CR=1 FL=1
MEAGRLTLELDPTNHKLPTHSGLQHVTDEVFFAIEQSTEWGQQYERLCASLGKVGEQQVPSTESALIARHPTS